MIKYFDHWLLRYFGHGVLPQFLHSEVFLLLYIYHHWEFETDYHHSMKKFRAFWPLTNWPCPFNHKWRIIQYMVQFNTFLCPHVCLFLDISHNTPPHFLHVTRGCSRPNIINVWFRAFWLLSNWYYRTWCTTTFSSISRYDWIFLLVTIRDWIPSLWRRGTLLHFLFFLKFFCFWNPQHVVITYDSLTFDTNINSWYSTKSIFTVFERLRTIIGSFWAFWSFYTLTNWPYRTWYTTFVS